MLLNTISYLKLEVSCSVDLLTNFTERKKSGSGQGF